MFGIRPDGRTTKNMDPLVMITPYIMPQRNDSQVFTDSEILYQPLVEYINEKSKDGYKISFMEIFIAAFVRIVSNNPELNRFVMNKKIYDRNELCVSVVVVKDTSNGEIEESPIKVKFDPYDTIFDVSARIKKEIEENKKEEMDNGTLSVVKLLMKIPAFPNLIIGGSRLLDRYGLLPKFLIDLLPFHTSLFITNTASIGLGRVYHHIYNYGTTSIFLSMGSPIKNIKIAKDGSPKVERMLPIGISVDERVSSGKGYSILFSELKKYLKNPYLLESEPDTIRQFKKCEYRLEKPDHQYIKK